MTKKSTAKAKASKPKAKAVKAITKPTKAKPSVEAKSLMVVYGYDEEQRARAAVFHEPDFKLARKAAGLMKFKVFVGKAETVQPALKGIKAGRVHATGNSFVPAVTLDRLEELIDVLALSKPPLPTASMNLPTSWDKIEVGHLVLGQADDPKAGFWEATVQSIDGDLLSLKARDFDITVNRHRTAVALMYTPDHASPQGLSGAAPGLPHDFGSLAPDHLVLALLKPSQGWFEAIVNTVEDGRVVLNWRDDANLPTFKRPLPQVALLYPKAP